MNEQEAIELAKKVMRCETCKYLRTFEDETYCSEISGFVYSTDDYHGVYMLKEYQSEFGCISWEKKE